MKVGDLVFGLKADENGVPKLARGVLVKIDNPGNHPPVFFVRGFYNPESVSDIPRSDLCKTEEEAVIRLNRRCIRKIGLLVQAMENVGIPSVTK